MPIPPEVLFDRFFGADNAGNTRNLYRGKHGLSGLEPPELEPLLVEIQAVLIEALNSEPSITDHPSLDPFHVDYVDSAVPNALAFGSDGYAFIGITISLIYAMWDTCFMLFPLRLVDFETLRDWECFDADTGKDSPGDPGVFHTRLQNWKNHDDYKKAFDRTAAGS
jgi:hypothetical protein